MVRKHVRKNKSNEKNVHPTVSSMGIEKDASTCSPTLSVSPTEVVLGDGNDCTSISSDSHQNVKKQRSTDCKGTKKQFKTVIITNSSLSEEPMKQGPESNITPQIISLIKAKKLPIEVGLKQKSEKEVQLNVPNSFTYTWASKKPAAVVKCSSIELSTNRKAKPAHTNECCNEEDEFYQNDSPKSLSPKEKKYRNDISDVFGCLGIVVSAQRICQRVLDTSFKLDVNMFYDSHCHLDYIYNRFKKSDGSLSTWMKKYPEAFPQNFGGCFPNFIDPELFVENCNSSNYDVEWLKSEIKNPKVLGCSYGCHPRFASKCSDEFIKTVERFCLELGTYKVKAIGECGLDFHRATEPFEAQVIALKRQIDLAIKFNLPLIIHCRSGARNAEEPCLTVLASHENFSRFHNIHRHCFNGSWETAQQWMSLFPNMYFGYTSCCYNFGSNSSEMEAFKNIPLDRILLETDAPYFKPTSFSNVSTGNVALPGMAIAVAEMLAKERKLSVEFVIQQTTKNFARMYVLNF